MTDTHCHLTAIAEPVEAAVAGLAAVVTVGTDLSDCRAVMALAARLPNVWAAIGIHPNNASDAATPATREALAQLAADPRVVAIGETGFDTHWQRESLASQAAAFDWHAGLAAELAKPLVLHVRDAQGRDDASRAAQEAIEAARHEQGVLHCCNGDERLVAAALDLGWYVSFAGNLTYKSAEALRATAASVPLERLLVETDSPYLTPAPRRGERNVPGNVRLTAARLAELRGVEERAMERQLDGNAQRLFALKVAA